MKELETVVQDEKNKWILITGILQVRQSTPSPPTI